MYFLLNLWRGLCYSPRFPNNQRMTVFNFNPDEENILYQLEELKKEHRALDEMIMSCSAKDQLQVQRLKREKLMLKDRLLKLEAMLHPDIIA